MKLRTHVPRLSGHGKVTVNHEDGTQTVVSDSNTLLDNFFSWLNDDDVWPDDSSTVIKVGHSQAGTVLTDTTLQDGTTLTSGSWPVCMVDGSENAELVDGGATILATRTYLATFSPGQVTGAISEYGLDVTGQTLATNFNVNTRVRLMDGDTPSSIDLELTDQLVVEYKLEMRIPSADRVEVVNITDKDGTTPYQCTSRFGKLSPFHHYMGLAAGGVATDAARQLLTSDAPLKALGVVETMNDTAENRSAVFVGDNKNGAKEVFVTMEGETNNHAGGIKSMILGNNDGHYKFEWEPAIPKTLINKLTFKLGLIFAR